MRAARDTADEIRTTEQSLLDRRSVEREDSFRTATATIVGSGVFNLILVGAIAYAVRRHVAAREAAAAHAVVSRAARVGKPAAARGERDAHRAGDPPRTIEP
jgi:hypothetical protein